MSYEIKMCFKPINNKWNLIKRENTSKYLPQHRVPNGQTVDHHQCTGSLMNPANMTSHIRHDVTYLCYDDVTNPLCTPLPSVTHDLGVRG